MSDGVGVGSKCGVALGNGSGGIAVGAKLGISELARLLAELLAASVASPAKSCGEQAAKNRIQKDIIIHLKLFLPREFTRRLR